MTIKDNSRSLGIPHDIPVEILDLDLNLTAIAFELSNHD
jgi:hypothetical protein